MLRPDLAGGDEPLVGVGRRHPDVDDRDRGLVHRDVAHEVRRRCRTGRATSKPASLEQPDDALAQQDRVLGDHHASSRCRASRPCCAAAGSRAAGRRRAAGGCARASAARRGGGCRGRGRRTPVGAQARRREQDLAAVTRRPDPRGAVDVDAGVALVGHERLADVDSHPHPDVVVARPGLLDQAPLRLDRGGDRVVERSGTRRTSRRRARR